ncbi:chitosanase [Micromonospora zhanjiangensis]|uniref:Chitosanase n=1 Tax=Micromonospora zhanjiangensis TaxID=1522057 RepID=A0ABV8KV55_9ACTN
MSRIRRRGTGLVGLLLVLVSACARTPADPWPEPVAGPSDVVLPAVQRRIADELVSVFENGTADPRYDYVERLDDGRGYTCGKIGFTTDGPEVRDVVAAWAKRRPGDPLVRYLPRLRELAADADGGDDGMAGFPAAWAAAAGDPQFRRIQDQATDRIAYGPALRLARTLGIRTALGVAVLFDTAVQHGMGADPDGLPALADRATRSARGRPADGTPEQRWLAAFLDVRAETLRHAHDPDTRAVWAESVDRVKALRRLVNDDRHGLTPPVPLTVFGDEYELR